MKGSVWFIENPSTLYSFHMSGRCRFEISIDTQKSSGTTTTGAFTVQLVAIGSDLKDIESRLEDCVTGDGLGSFSGERRKAVVDAIVSNDYFVVGDCPELSSFVDFWVSGCIDYGVTIEEAMGFHGINFNRMNEELAMRVNGSSGGVSILPVRLESGGKTVCRHCIDEGGGFEATWKVVQDAGNKVVSDVFRAVGVCKCWTLTIVIIHKSLYIIFDLKKMKLNQVGVVNYYLDH